MSPAWPFNILTPCSDLKECARMHTSAVSLCVFYARADQHSASPCVFVHVAFSLS